MHRKLFLGLSVALFLNGAAFGAVQADNTAVNQRDRAQDEVTADQQKINQSDTEITRLIRRAVVKDSSLSTYAHNVKIITIGQHVTLKGPVRSIEEKNKVFTAAIRVAGKNAVTNELSIVKSE